MRCLRCHRPLKREPGPHGMGPKCEKTAGATAAPDLFTSPEDRVAAHLDVVVAGHLAAMREGFAAARRRLGIWA